jgi:S-layer homology domain
MRLPLRRIRLWMLLPALAATLNGCLFGQTLNIFSEGDGFVSISQVGDIPDECTQTALTTYRCDVNGETSEFLIVDPALLLFLFLVDPVVVQLPASASNFAGSFLHNGTGTSGPLAITAGLASLPIDVDRTLVAEPGTQLVIVGFPPGAPTTGNFSFNFNFRVPPGTTVIPVKLVLTGLVQPTAGGAIFYPPILPCVDDMASAPALTVPLPGTLTLPPFTGLGCQGVTYNYVQGVAPSTLMVDAAPLGSDGNLVFEPGETVVVTPGWRNSTGSPQSYTGAASSFTGPDAPGLAYSITDTSADYGTVPTGTTADCAAATGDCYRLAITTPPVRPAQHWDTTFHEQLSTGETKTWTLHIGDSFADVPRANPFYPFIETIFHRGVTTGCGATTYCPGSPTTREQMAAFLLRGRGEFDPPPPATQRFLDVPPTNPFYRFIDRLAVLGITFGCGGGSYCPGAPISREQMAAFIIRALGEFDPPQPATQRFLDVPPTNPFYRFIERMAVLGITSGCGGGNYCPTDPVTREQMSVFLSEAFGLTLYGP